MFPKLSHNFLLQFCPEVQGEQETRKKLAAIGLGAGKSFDLDKLSEADKAEEALGVKEAYDEIVKKKENLGTKINGWNVSASYGDRAFYHGDWLLRAAAALAGIYGNSTEEAMYPATANDVSGQPLDGDKGKTLSHLPQVSFLR